MFPSNALIADLKRTEGFRATAYPDSTGYSIGYGTFIDTAAEQWLLHATIDEEQASDLLTVKLQELVDVIGNRIHIALTQNQVDALVKMLYNAGPGPITSGTLDDLINSNAGEAAIRAKWMQYNKTHDANGVLRTSEELTARRKSEVDLYFSSAPGKVFLAIAIGLVTAAAVAVLVSWMLTPSTK